MRIWIRNANDYLYVTKLFEDITNPPCLIATLIWIKRTASTTTNAAQCAMINGLNNRKETGKNEEACIDLPVAATGSRTSYGNTHRPMDNKVR
jgi:hypothetical protein